MRDTCNHLADGIRRRDPAALQQLIAQMSGPVLHLVGMILGSLGRPEDVEEAAADVFTAVWQRIHQFDPARGSFRNWVLVLAKYISLDRRRQLLRRQSTPAGEAQVVPLQAIPEPPAPHSPEEQVVARDRQERLQQALARLPAAERELLIRRYFFEESIAELARGAGVSTGALYNRLWRARQQLKALLVESQCHGDWQARQNWEAGRGRGAGHQRQTDGRVARGGGQG